MILKFHYLEYILQCQFHTHTHKGVRKFKGSRLILLNSQILIFFMAFVTIVVKVTKHE